MEWLVVSTSPSEALSYVWNSATRTLHHTLKPDTGTHTLALGHGTFISSQSAKGALHVWNLGVSEAPSQKAVTPERLGAVACSADGSWLFGGGVSGRVYVWAMGSGALVNTVNAHYRQVTALAVTLDGACLITGGDDGIIHVWMVSSLVDVKTQEAPTAMHTWTNHGLKITSLFCALGPAGETLVVSGSLDSSVKLWKLPQGNLVADVVYSSNIGAVALDAFEQTLFAGSTEGTIYCLRFAHEPVVAQVSMSGDDVSSGSRLVLKGHSGAITSLAVVCHGLSQVLISASTDTTVNLWDIASGQLIGSFRKHTGPVSSLAVFPRVPNQKTQASVVGKIQKYTRRVGADGKIPSESSLFWVRGSQNKVSLPDFPETLWLQPEGKEIQHHVGALEAEVERLQNLNRTLFEFDVEQVLKSKKSRKRASRPASKNVADDDEEDDDDEDDNDGGDAAAAALAAHDENDDDC